MLHCDCPRPMTSSSEKSKGGAALMGGGGGGGGISSIRQSACLLGFLYLLMDA